MCKSVNFYLGMCAFLFGFATGILFGHQAHTLEPECSVNNTGLQVSVLRDAHQDLVSQVVTLETVLDRSVRHNISPYLSRMIIAAADNAGIRHETAFGLVREESYFSPNAVSYAGAIGLSQVMPATGAMVEPGTTVDDLFDPETNLRIGFTYLREMIDKYGDEHTALVAYNVGPHRVDTSGVTPFRQSIAYADRVLR